ncbi:hypothetical protein HDV00_007917 [Rhizophlyctis rosea]|nr:hypothetical protein HDV00_007917 [Rhizophlyctis rosea]
MRVDLIASTAVLASASLAHGSALEKRLNNGLELTPALGWNSWNAGGCSAASASFALQTAKNFQSLGLQRLGYQYIVIDDCWSLKSRNSSGYLVPDPSKFPNGIKGLADQIHSMGLKFGLYGCAGTKTCGGYPGSQGYETKDAQTMASWGVDFWKYDNCYTPCNQGSVQTCGSPIGNTQTWMTTMHNALASSGRNILYNLCQWGRDNVWTWGAGISNSWRMSVDNWGDWASVVRIASSAATISQYSGPGGFNDLDMLIIGNGGLTDAEERTHFGLWAMCKSPLILGTDLSKIKSSSLKVVTNAEIIAINQDKLGKAATTFRPSNAAAPVSGRLYSYWYGPLSDGVVIGLVAADGATTLAVNFKDVPGLGTGTYSWKELYTGVTGTGTSVSFSLSTHDMALIKVTTSSTTNPTPTTTITTTQTSTGSSTTRTSTTGGSSCAAMWGQCGGQGWVSL